MLAQKDATARQQMGVREAHPSAGEEVRASAGGRVGIHDGERAGLHPHLINSQISIGIIPC
jgi:hypothetical protein